jgi:hypothetical protein
MTNSEMEKAIRAMAEHLADQVVKLISSRTLKELAAFSGERRSSPSRSAPAERAESKPSKKGGKDKPAKKSAKSAPAKASKPAKRSGPRATPAEVSAAVLGVLKKSKEFMKATAIIAALDSKPTTELLGRVLRDLVARGFITKRGATRATEYQITMSGLEQ